MFISVVDPNLFTGSAPDSERGVMDPDLAQEVDLNLTKIYEKNKQFDNYDIKNTVIYILIEKDALKSLALRKSEPELFAGQVGSGSRSR
jgi:hypothetical protein